MSVGDRRLSVHHIGGRSGTRAFPLVKEFEKDVVNVLYEADVDCVEQIKRENQALGSELCVLPYCIGGDCSSAVLNINYDPYTSSLYDRNPYYDAYYLYAKTHDYPLAEAFKTMERRRVEMVTFDNIFFSQAPPVPPPDFLSVDTQGSEYDILRGATKTLESNVLAVVLEVEFHPIYQDQKLFGDLSSFLTANGFHFAKFLSLYEMSAYRAPIGLRAEGFHVFGEALFLKRLEDVLLEKDELKRNLKLEKLALIAIVYDQFEYALGCLRALDRYSGWIDVEDRSAQPSYRKFLRELSEEINKTPEVFPATFSAKYSFEQSKRRFDLSDGANHSRLSPIKAFVKSVPVLYASALSIINFRRALSKKTVVWRRRARFGWSGVEAVLLKYGLRKQAEELRERRILHSIN